MPTKRKRVSTAAKSRKKQTIRKTSGPKRVRRKSGFAAPRPPVARITRNLTRLENDPNSSEALAQAQADIQTHGLKAFFHAAARTPLGQRMLEAEAILAQARAIAPTERGLLVPARGDEGELRQTWHNSISSLNPQPLRIFRPTSLPELRSIVHQAAAEGCKVKAVGSGHSFTDVAVTRDFLIETHGYCKPIVLEPKVLRQDVDTGTLYETEGGIILRDLNEALWNAGLGLLNMGGYDGQTIAGVMSTSTHGSGITFGPLTSFVESFTLVASDSKVWRIEPSNGITDPAQWSARHPDIELKQDDDWFHACQVGIGCMGIIYSIVLRVRERYFLEEVRTVKSWSQLRHDLAEGSLLRDNRHCEILVNPYQVNGDNTCLITVRNPVPEPAEPRENWPHRNYLVELLAGVPGAGGALATVLNTFPDLIPTITEKGMETLARICIDRSYRVLNAGAAISMPGYASEIGFTMDNYIAATDRILEIAAQRQRVGKSYFTAPLSLRFVKASHAFVSPMYGADTCMIELLMVDGTVGGREMLQELEYELYAFGGRPHWSLLNFLSGANGLVEAMYPMLTKWLAVRRQLDSDDMFDNDFTERCGFAARKFVRN